MSVWLTAANQLRTTRILGVKTESPTVKTFTFKDRQCVKAKPGQFLMLWIPGVDEIPLSILNVEKDGTVSVAVKRVGEATEALHNKKAGEIIGVRGPFGKSFTLKSEKILMVGGGTGIAPLLFLAKMLGEKAEITFVTGARTREELLFLYELYSQCGEENVLIVTEDGSYGVKGLATKPLEALITNEKFNMIYTCGPEQMVYEVFSLAEKHGISFEASLERLMRCAIGICGSCVIGKYRVCRDGPVFTAERLEKVKGEFGLWKRDFDGKKIPIE